MFWVRTVHCHEKHLRKEKEIGEELCKICHEITLSARGDDVQLKK